MKKSPFSNRLVFRALALSFALLVAACEDPLDAEPKGQLAEGISNAETVDNLVTAAYKTLTGLVDDQPRALDFFPAFVGPPSNWVHDVRSDDAHKGGGGTNDLADVHALEMAQMLPTNAVCKHEWRNGLYGVSRCNLAIREIASLDDDSYPKAVRTAEMRLLRGHHHFELIRNFGQVPYILQDDAPAPKPTPSSRSKNCTL